MNEKQEKEPKYVRFVWYILGWFVIANILHRLPIAPMVFTDLYIVLGIIYSITVISLYGKYTKRYLYFYYHESCNNAMRKLYQVPPFNDNDEYFKRQFNLRSFNAAVRRGMFEPTDRKILEIRRNNIYREIFFSIMFFHITMFISFR